MKPTSTRLLATFLLAMAAPLVHGAGAPDQGPRCRYVNVAKLPLRYTGPSLDITTDGVIDGTPAAMLVDTGASNTFLTRTGTERRGMKLSAVGQAAEGIGGLSAIYQTRIKEFVVGSTRSERGFLRVLSDFGYTPSFDAILGAPFLLQADLEVSLGTKELKLFRPADCRDSFLAYWDADALAIPFDGYHGDSPNPVFTVFVNGQKMRAMIDTGAQMTAISLAAARRAGMKPDAPGAERTGSVVGVGDNKVARWNMVFKTFQIGEETIENAEIGVIEKGARHIDVLLGADFLRAHRVLFAMSQRKLYFSYVGGEPFGQRRTIEPWMRAEADAGNADAQMALASMYGNGWRVARNDATASGWLEKAAANGSAQALLYSGRKLMLANDFAGAATRLRSGLDKLPSDRQAALWLYLARVRSSQHALAKSELTAAFASGDRDEWPVPLADFYLGTLPAEKLLLAAADARTQAAPRSCHALAAMVEWHRAHAQEEQAAALATRTQTLCANGTAATSWTTGQLVLEDED